MVVCLVPALTPPMLRTRALKSLRRVLPRRPGTGRPTSAWVAGCATVEDAYLVAAWLGAGAGRSPRVLATEADPAKLARARQGRCRRCLLAELPAGARRRLFVDDGASLCPRPALRKACLFQLGAPAQKPPAHGLDLVVCPGAASPRMLATFHDALADGGLLVLGGGRAEKGLFEAVDSRLRLYRKRARAAAPSRPAHAELEALRRRHHESLADVSHDLRGPASTIRGVAETLRLGVPGRARRAAFLRSIERQAGRVASMADRLEHGAAGPSLVALAEAVDEAVEASSDTARRRGVRVSARVPGRLSALADAGDLSHVLANLLENAVKFSPRGGRVEVSARRTPEGPVLSVRDHGRGIPSGDLERVFERRYRGARTRGVPGSGLGLSIVRRLVEAAGGRVWARNAAGGGALLQVRLPSAPEARA